MTDPLANEEMALIVEYFPHSRMYLVCLELIVVDRSGIYGFMGHGSLGESHVRCFDGEATERTRPPADLGAGSGQSQAPLGLHIPECHSAHCSHGWSQFKDTALRTQSAVETIWQVHVTEPR